MPKPEIIGSARSTYTRVVCMVCEEKGIAYGLTECALGAPELLAIHPLGKMPVLRHGDVVLFESKAIASYLDRSFPGPQLLPSDPHLAGLTEQWVSLVNTVIDRTLIRTYLYAYIAPKTADGKPDRAAIEAVMPAVREQLGILDHDLTQRNMHKVPNRGDICKVRAVISKATGKPPRLSGPAVAVPTRRPSRNSAATSRVRSPSKPASAALSTPIRTRCPAA